MFKFLLYIFVAIILIIGLAIQNGADKEQIYKGLDEARINISYEGNNTVEIIAYDFIEFMSRSAALVMKEGANYAEKNQDLNYNLLLKLLILAMLMPIIVYGVKLIVLTGVIINEYRIRKREEKQDELDKRKNR